MRRTSRSRPRQLLLAWMLAAAIEQLHRAAAATDPQAEELKAAINAEYTFRPTNWDSAILNDTLSNLKLESILWSAKPRRFDFTVFTQLTVNRLPTLFNMCTTFTGPLSAAVYVPLVQVGAEKAGRGRRELLLSGSGQQQLQQSEGSSGQPRVLSGSGGYLPLVQPQAESKSGRRQMEQGVGQAGSEQGLQQQGERLGAAGQLGVRLVGRELRVGDIGLGAAVEEEGRGGGSGGGGGGGGGSGSGGGTGSGRGGRSLLSAANAALLADAVARVEALHSRTESLPSGCQLDLMLFSEVFDSPQAALLYPVNYLRNYARMQVRTRLLAMIDVDMYMSASLSREMEQPGSIPRYEALCEQRRATVLPAFEPTKPGAVGRDMATNLTKMSKPQLAAVHGRNKAAIQFKLRVFPRGHTPTNYTRWFAETQPYQVTYKRFYEPWFITCNEIMPWYDVDFRGYGMNKIVLIAALNYYNYSFWIHPDAWLVHNPHADTEVRKLVAREASDVNKLNVKLPANALYRKLTVLFGKAKRGMMRGTYDPRVDPRMLAVYDKVSWLRPAPKLVGSPTPESVFT
ncbi:hypothetical protein Agub_g13537 [Astrephomene gubernaculifera]|uniref:Uncharacterized protein n=1 Tax=Astrephomene gubernaculifera TaxID=47775 RepID=A0AAD3E4D3_9CHLO|nr:hypothetical protein Agub_g13537 [Astrephomene gubernaculifera]